MLLGVSSSPAIYPARRITICYELERERRNAKRALAKRLRRRNNSIPYNKEDIDSENLLQECKPKRRPRTRIENHNVPMKLYKPHELQVPSPISSDAFINSEFELKDFSIMLEKESLRKYELYTEIESEMDTETTEITNQIENSTETVQTVPVSNNLNAEDHNSSLVSNTNVDNEDTEKMNLTNVELAKSQEDHKKVKNHVSTEFDIYSLIEGPISRRLRSKSIYLSNEDVAKLQSYTDNSNQTKYQEPEKQSDNNQKSNSNSTKITQRRNSLPYDHSKNRSKNRKRDRERERRIEKNRKRREQREREKLAKACMESSQPTRIVEIDNIIEEGYSFVNKSTVSKLRPRNNSIYTSISLHRLNSIPERAKSKSNKESLLENTITDKSIPLIVSVKSLSSERKTENFIGLESDGESTMLTESICSEENLNHHTDTMYEDSLFNAENNSSPENSLSIQQSAFPENSPQNFETPSTPPQCNEELSATLIHSDRAEIIMENDNLITDISSNDNSQSEVFPSGATETPMTRIYSQQPTNSSTSIPTKAMRKMCHEDHKFDLHVSPVPEVDREISKLKFKNCSVLIACNDHDYESFKSDYVNLYQKNNSKTTETKASSEITYSKIPEVLKNIENEEFESLDQEQNIVGSNTEESQAKNDAVYLVDQKQNIIGSNTEESQMENDVEQIVGREQNIVEFNTEEIQVKNDAERVVAQEQNIFESNTEESQVKNDAEHLDSLIKDSAIIRNSSNIQKNDNIPSPQVQNSRKYILRRLSTINPICYYPPAPGRQKSALLSKRKQRSVQQVLSPTKKPRNDSNEIEKTSSKSNENIREDLESQTNESPPSSYNSSNMFGKASRQQVYMNQKRKRKNDAPLNEPIVTKSLSQKRRKPTGTEEIASTSTNKPDGPVYNRTTLVSNNQKSLQKNGQDPYEYYNSDSNLGNDDIILPKSPRHNKTKKSPKTSPKSKDRDGKTYLTSLDLLIRSSKERKHNRIQAEKRIVETVNKEIDKTASEIPVLADNLNKNLTECEPIVKTTSEGENFRMLNGEETTASDGFLSYMRDDNPNPADIFQFSDISQNSKAETAINIVSNVELTPEQAVNLVMSMGQKNTGEAMEEQNYCGGPGVDPLLDQYSDDSQNFLDKSPINYEEIETEKSVGNEDEMNESVEEFQSESVTGADEFIDHSELNIETPNSEFENSSIEKTPFINAVTPLSIEEEKIVLDPDKSYGEEEVEEENLGLHQYEYPNESDSDADSNSISNYVNVNAKNFSRNSERKSESRTNLNETIVGSDTFGFNEDTKRGNIFDISDNLKANENEISIDSLMNHSNSNVQADISSNAGINDNVLEYENQTSVNNVKNVESEEQNDKNLGLVNMPNGYSMNQYINSDFGELRENLLHYSDDSGCVGQSNTNMLMPTVDNVLPHIFEHTTDVASEVEVRSSEEDYTNEADELDVQEQVEQVELEQSYVELNDDPQQNFSYHFISDNNITNGSAVPSQSHILQIDCNEAYRYNKPIMNVKPTRQIEMDIMMSDDKKRRGRPRGSRNRLKSNSSSHYYVIHPLPNK